MKRFLIYLFLFLNIQTVLLAGQSVVCLHGFFRSYKCMIPMGNTLRNEGFNVYLWDYRSRKKNIEGHADDLVGILKVIAEQNPGEPIHFVTHSLGGIIVRAAVNHPKCPQEARIGKAVLLAPPNKGAQLARKFKDYTLVKWIFGKRAGNQLLTYGDEDMRTFGKFPDTMSVMVIAGDKHNIFSQKWLKSPNDGKVTIEETYLDTPHIHHVQHVSHSWIMTSKETIHKARAYFLNQLPASYFIMRQN